MGKHEPLSSAERTARHRAKMRALGLKPKQFWLPDVNDPAFIAEAKRQSRLAAQCSDSEDVQKFIDAITDEWLAELDAAEEAASDS
ncbi:antitoxin MazE family protein [Pelagerythrobacter sp.]|uniref:antitoxin MazE family protein n=1 Tax=Pelagerythrobacter sp. TaxID=2800702 RepID=UPI0035B47836